MKTTKINEAQLLLNAQCTLGEGPIWDAKSQTLFWVDIEGKQLHNYNPEKEDHRFWELPSMAGAAVLKEDGNLLLALEEGLTTIDIHSGNITSHEVLKNSNPKMRYNDGKVGPNGHFYIGSMHKEVEPGSGNLYRVSSNWETDIQVPNTTISNGMAWTKIRIPFISAIRRNIVFTGSILIWHPAICLIVVLPLKSQRKWAVPRRNVHRRRRHALDCPLGRKLH